MRAPVTQKDPKLRPFRVAAYALYLGVVGTFSVLVIVSVIRSVWAMSPGRPEVRGETLPTRVCLQQADALWQKLEGERRTFSDAKNASTLVEGWQRFRLAWLRELREAQARCGTEAPERAQLARVFDRLERVADLYTTSATQYGGEIAPALAAYRKAVSQAAR
jgi:hypothetical protein